MAPRAVPKNLICSECGLDWDLHPENPKRRDCIKLLRAQTGITYVPFTVNPQPYQYWWGTNYGTTTTFSGTLTT